ncbi:hypothetical protein O181_068651 [Austropuccinia psidii MF-1]|uniref:Uncharacterized protein n=1 Tax=Austropuccinia psidii MF-1 TaxID=1389203 RepID=A0A9Q3F1Z6_9BASI|nr:hypothetical protein [Austropuccinia psidii MF-1]
MFSIASSWAEIGIITQNICLKKMTWLDLMEEIKAFNPNNNFKLSEETENRIKENQEAIQAIEKSLNMGEPSQIQVPQDREERVPSSPNNPEAPGLTSKTPLHPRIPNHTL